MKERELIATGNYHMHLNTSKVEGGVTIRICPSTGNLSCLDFPIVLAGLLPYVKRVLVDSAREAVTKKGKLTVTFTDHYPVHCVKNHWKY